MHQIGNHSLLAPTWRFCLHLVCTNDSETWSSLNTTYCRAQRYNSCDDSALLANSLFTPYDSKHNMWRAQHKPITYNGHTPTAVEILRPEQEIWGSLEVTTQSVSTPHCRLPFGIIAKCKQALTRHFALDHYFIQICLSVSTRHDATVVNNLNHIYRIQQGCEVYLSGQHTLCVIAVRPLDMLYKRYCIRKKLATVRTSVL